jgi:hypothetical protein
VAEPRCRFACGGIVSARLSLAPGQDEQQAPAGAIGFHVAALLRNRNSDALAAPFHGGPCRLAKLRNHPAFNGLARSSIAQLRRVALRKARVDNLFACDTGRVVANLKRLGRGGGVLATVNEEFAYGSAGRISPRFKLTRRGRRLASDPPARIRARATLELCDRVGDVERLVTTFTMTRGGRAPGPR